MKRLVKNILQESKPYDFLLLMVSAIVGFVLSLFGNTNITCVCATAIVVLFIISWLSYNIKENKADYMRIINKEYKNEHWYEVLYLALPICPTLRRMGKYKQSVEVAEKLLDILNKINPENIDAECIKEKYTNIEKLKERLMINDLGYSYFILKKIEKAKRYIHNGMDIARKNKIGYAELKGWTILLQMMLIDNYRYFFTKDDEDEIYSNFCKLFEDNWGYLGNEFPPPDSKGYIPYLKSLEIKVKYEFKRLRIKGGEEFLAMMEKLESEYKKMKLIDKYNDCRKCIYEIKLSDNKFDRHGSEITSLANLIDGAFDPNVGLTPVQYIKYVTIFLEYSVRMISDEDSARKRDAEENSERISKYIKKIEKELWYVEDPCINRFYKAKKEYARAMKGIKRV